MNPYGGAWLGRCHDSRGFMGVLMISHAKQRIALGRQSKPPSRCQALVTHTPPFPSSNSTRCLVESPKQWARRPADVWVHSSGLLVNSNPVRNTTQMHQNHATPEPSSTIRPLELTSDRKPFKHRSLDLVNCVHQNEITEPTKRLKRGSTSRCCQMSRVLLAAVRHIRVDHRCKPSQRRGTSCLSCL